MQTPTRSLRSATAPAAAALLLALLATVPPAGAHLNETNYVEAHGLIGAVCWELDGLVVLGATLQPGATTLGALLSAAPAFLGADGSSLSAGDQALVADGLAALDPVLAVAIGQPQDGVAPFTIGDASPASASVEDLVTCNLGHGRYRSAAQHTHFGTTLFETSSEQGDYTSGAVSVAWASPSGVDTGAIAILGLPFVVDGAGGGYGSSSLFGLDCHPFIRDLLATGTTDVNSIALTPVSMYADGYSPQLPPLRVKTTFCGWGVAYDVTIDSDHLLVTDDELLDA